MGDVMQEIPVGTPLRDAWEQWKQTDEYANSFNWATFEQHREGSFWNVYYNGYQAADVEITRLREQVRVLREAVTRNRNGVFTLLDTDMPDIMRGPLDLIYMDLDETLAVTPPDAPEADGDT